MRIHTVLVAVALGCSPTFAHPPYAPQPQAALVEVTAPPPPGRIEVVPPAPSATAVWVDGEWAWHRGRWAWLPGRWVGLPKGAQFSPSEFVRGADGRLWYAAGAWRDANGAPVDAPPPLASATVGSNEVVNASGSTENTGPTLKHPSAPANHR